MKKLLVVLAVLAVAGIANATVILAPHGGFEEGIGSVASGWGTWAGGGGVVTWVPTGGNGGAYAQVDTFAAGSWAGLVAPHDNDVPISLATLGVTAGQPATFSIDIKEFTAQTGAHGVGMKIESWGVSGYIQNHGGDQAVSSVIAGGGWNSYTFDVTIDPAATGMKLVPVWGDGGSYGFDNLGTVVPEPMTMALLGLGGLLLRRRRA